MLDHPIGLACLFMDDGSLVVNNYKKSNTITLFPQIFIYSQSFSKEENILLKNHIKDIFHIDFKLSKRNDESNYILQINKRNQVYNFLKVIKPYVEDIPEMIYKINAKNKLLETKDRFIKKYPDKTIRISNKIAIDTTYTKDDEIRIEHMIYKSFSYKEIAEDLGRSYYGVYSKVESMRSEGNFQCKGSC